MKKEYLLAIHHGHNSSCALMENGVIIAAAQEERFSRKKNHLGYPRCAIDYCLKKAGIKGNQLSQAGFTTVNVASIYNKSRRAVRFSIRDYLDFYGEKYYLRKFRNESCLDYLKWLRDAPRFNDDKTYFDFSYLTDEVLENPARDAELFRRERVRTITRHLDIAQEKVKFLDHHSCHAYYGYFGSPFRGEDCIVITLDGWGDNRNQTVWKACGDELELIAESTQNELGHLYKLTTLLLGMCPDQDEYKVMGLAPYAKRPYAEEALEVIRDILRIEKMRLIHKKRPRDLFSYLKDSWQGYRFDNIAGAVQLYTELTARELVEDIHRETGIGRFVLSGGVAMNVKMNKAIAQLPCVSALFVCASGGDESLSLGGCYYLNRQNRNNRPLKDMYLGYDINDDLAVFDWADISGDYTVKQQVSNREIAGLLAEGDILARVCGCAEFGARALGNRSILADPSRKDIVTKMNRAIKNRDFWMPFALSILNSHVNEYIHNPKGIEAPVMSIAFDTRPQLYQNIQAGTHPYDKSVRPQFVCRDFNPGFYDLIEQFHKRTGIPALLNTSFNLHGEPIVNNIADALRTFRHSGLDHLVINDTLISKKNR